MVIPHESLTMYTDMSVLPCQKVGDALVREELTLKFFNRPY
jgi:hypothetical protein